MRIDKEKLEKYLTKLEESGPEEIMKLVEKHLDDDDIEMICEHIEYFYGIEDDEEIGQLAQIMVAGFVMAKETSK